MRRILLATFTTLVALSCAEPTAPRPLGRFVLTSLDGRPEPFVWFDHTFSTGERRVFTILADTVALAPGGRLQRSDAHASRSIQPDGTIMETTSASSTAGTHRQEGDRVIMERIVLGQSGTFQVDTMLFRNGALEQTKLMGLYCANEPCPAPRNVLLRYERR